MFSLPIISPVFRLAMRIVSIVVWALTIISAFGGKFNPEYLTIPSVLCLALPYLTILSVLLIIFWACTKKLIFMGLGILVIVFCADPITQVIPLNHSKKAEEGSRHSR